MSNEIAFPRGGTPKVLLRTGQQHDISGIDNVRNSAERGTKRTRASFDKKVSEKKNKTGEEVEDDTYAGVFRQTISIELLSQNLRGLAFVKFINDLDITLECVDGIQLKLTADRISKVFTNQIAQTKATLADIFHRGQAFAFKLVKGATKKIGQKKPICHVTICSYEVNSNLVPTSLLAGTVLNGIVSSIEEKGVIIDLGFSTSSAKGFVQRDELPPYLQPEQLHIGQVAMFRVKEKPTADTRVIRLTGFLEMEGLDDSAKINGKQLMPGTVLHVQPEKVVFDGVFVGIKNGPKAYIRKVHLPPRLRFDPQKLTKLFRACVLCSQPNSSLLVLSAHPDICALTKLEKRLLPQDVKIGSRMNFIVYHVDKKQNIYFKLDEDGDKQTVTAKCLRINVENPEENLPKFTIGSSHECRIVGYSSVERQLLVSTRTTDLSRKIVAMEEAVPGTKLKCTVLAVKQSGIVVAIGNDVCGFVPSMHVLDRPTEKWQKRFQKDQKILCRVLFTDTLAARLMLTAKPAMVKATGSDKLITSLDKQFEGAISTGTIIKQLEGGSLLVAFYNRVAGILHPSFVSKLPPEATQIGAALRVRVGKINPELGQMILELPARDNVQQLSMKAVGMERLKQRKEKPMKPKTTTGSHAKPFGIYTARVVGPWPYGGTSAETTAELLFPDGGIGRLHVSELNNPHEFVEGACPMEHFLGRNKGKMINVKVLSVSKHKAISKSVRQQLVDLHQTDRIVECTAREEKLQEPRRKHSLINYRSNFDCGDLVPVFIVVPNSAEKLDKINPDFHALINRDQIKIPSILSRMEQLASSDTTAMVPTTEELFDKGELRFGRVLGVNKTKRGRIILLELVDRNPEDAVFTDQKITRKRKRTESKLDEKEEENGEEQTQMEVEEADVKGNAEESAQQSSSEEEMDEEEEDFEDEEKKTIMDLPDECEKLPSVDAYERQLKKQPNSVPLWLGYLHFHMGSNVKAKKRYELGKSVAERALKLISFQNDSDLAKMWRAYLTLEVLLGTEESLEMCFKRACASTESYEMHKFLIDLLKQQPNAEGRDEEIRTYFESMVKKFKNTHMECWFVFGKHLLQHGDAGECRQLLKRSLQCTEKRKHLSILKNFAQLEERYGDKERAKTMQELIKNTKEEAKQLDVSKL